VRKWTGASTDRFPWAPPAAALADCNAQIASRLDIGSAFSTTGRIVKERFERMRNVLLQAKNVFPERASAIREIVSALDEC